MAPSGNTLKTPVSSGQLTCHPGRPGDDGGGRAERESLTPSVGGGDLGWPQPPCPQGVSHTSQDQWFSLALPAQRTVTVSTVGGAYWDTKLSVYDGACGALPRAAKGQTLPSGWRGAGGAVKNSVPQ